MPKDFSSKKILGINISDFTGIYRAIAEKANINGGNTLEGIEISLFFDAKNTIDKNKSIFTFNGKTYDVDGNLYTGDKVYEAKKDAVNYKIPWAPPPKDYFKLQNAKLKNQAALKKVDEYIALEKEEIKKKKIQHEEIVKKLSNSWGNTFKVNDRENFSAFIEKLYQAVEMLNIKKTNDGTTKETFQPSEKYPTIEDKIVDEMCGAFAYESKFSTRAISDDKLYYGIFQFSQVGLNDVNKKLSNNLLDIGDIKLKPLKKIKDFVNLSRIEQIDYMIAYVKDCKQYYSKIGENEPISPKQMYAMWYLPSKGKDSVEMQKRMGIINTKLNERNNSNLIQ